MSNQLKEEIFGFQQQELRHQRPMEAEDLIVINHPLDGKIIKLKSEKHQYIKMKEEANKEQAQEPEQSFSSFS